MELSLLEIARILVKKIWIIALSTVIGFSAALLISFFLMAPKYTSKSQLYVNPNRNQIDQANTYTDLQYAQKLVNSYLIILQNDVFLKQVADSSGLNYTSGQIRGMISLSAINNTEIFEVRVEAPSPDDAHTLVNTIVELAPAEIVRIRELDSVRVVTPATMPVSPSSPNKSMNAAVGAILGLLISAAVVVLIEVLDTRVKSEEDLTNHYELPVIGSIPKYEEK